MSSTPHSSDFHNEQLKHTPDLPETYLALFENNMDAAYLLDRNGFFLRGNRALEKLLDLPRHDIIGQSFSHFINEPYLEETNKVFREAVKGHPSNKLITSAVHSSGKTIKISVTVVPVYKHNEVAAVIGLAKDLSDIEAYRERLERIETSLNDAQSVANIGSWDYNVEKNESLWSKQLFTIFGMPEQSSFPQAIENYTSRVHPDDRHIFETDIDKLLRKGFPMDHEARIIRENGAIREVHVQGKPIYNKDGKITRLIGTVHDITQLKNAVSMLKDNEAQMAKIYNNLEECIWSADPRRQKLLFHSDSFEKMFGYPIEQIFDAEFFLNHIVHEDHRAKVLEAANQLEENKGYSIEYKLRNASGEVKWVLDKRFPVFSEAGELVRIDGIIWDITESKKAQHKMHHIAYHDHLTGLPNRRYFDQAVNEAVKEATASHSRFSLLYIDLDRFKHINDMLGHSMGDALLQSAAYHLRKTLGSAPFIARLSGDEFGVILKDSGTDDARKVAVSILETFREPFLIHSYDLHITASIAVTTYPDNAKDVNELLKNLDAALQRAKRNGKNKYECFDPEFKNNSVKNYFLEKELRRAITQDELFLEYQPKLDPATGETTGSEALVRWQHPEFGTISPGTFIPVAEQSDLICDVGEWVIIQAFKQMDEWQKSGIAGMPVSVNISAHHLYKKNLVHLVAQCLKTYRIPSAQFEIEITETSLIQSSETVYTTLEDLNKLGIKVSLDDFGIGYSSLTHLLKFNLDTLKIDKSLIERLPHSEKDCTIISSLIRMADGLGMTVVAEGVETSGQLEFLRKNNCHYIQGYLYSRPLLPDAFSAFVNKGPVVK